MAISPWELSQCLLSGVFFIFGLVEFFDLVKMCSKLERRNRKCTQQTVGIVTPQTHNRGLRGFGQVVFFSYDVEKKHFVQKSCIGYEDGTYQWGQQVTVCYDPTKPEDCYLDGDIELSRKKLFSGILFFVLWCPFWGFSLISHILNML